MIKVLKQGTKNIVDCAFCGATLSYQNSDIKEKEIYYSQRETNFIKYIVCPQCQFVIDLQKE